MTNDVMLRINCEERRFYHNMFFCFCRGLYKKMFQKSEAFATSLSEKVCEDGDKQSNACACPVSVHMTLALVAKRTEREVWKKEILPSIPSVERKYR